MKKLFAAFILFAAVAVVYSVDQVRIAPTGSLGVDMVRIENAPLEIDTISVRVLIATTSVGIGTNVPTSALDILNGSITVRGSRSEIGVSTISGVARINFLDSTFMITAPTGGGASGISTMTCFLGDFGSVYLATSINQAVDSFPNMGVATVTFRTVSFYTKNTSTDAAIPLIYSLNRSTEIGATNVAFSEVFRATITAGVKTSTPAVLGSASEIILYPQQTLHLFYNQIPAGTLPGGKHGAYLEYYTWQKQ